MTAEQFQDWLAAMSISGAEAGRLLGVQPNTITRYRREGGSRVLALACAALSHRLRPWFISLPPDLEKRVASATGLPMPLQPGDIYVLGDISGALLMSEGIGHKKLNIIRDWIFYAGFPKISGRADLEDRIKRLEKARQYAQEKRLNNDDKHT